MAYPLYHPLSTDQPPLLIAGAAFARHFPGESRHVEFKQGASRSRIARAVAAFSNTDGGVLLVGVGPDGRPVGTNVDGEALAEARCTGCGTRGSWCRKVACRAPATCWPRPSRRRRD